MATVHTTARGTEPYDKVYCLGYQVHHEDWSPYPRINKLRQTFLDRGYDVDVERLRLVTESYQRHEHLPEKLKVAYAFENVLLHCGIEIYDGRDRFARQIRAHLPGIFRQLDPGRGAEPPL